MAFSASDFKIYNAAVAPEDDTTTGIGGAIDTTSTPILGDVSTDSDITLQSSGADTAQVIVTGIKSDRTTYSATITLNGTTPVSTGQTWIRILKIVPQSAVAGTITVKQSVGGATIGTIPPGKKFHRLFYYAKAPSTGTRTYYEKIFIKNEGAQTLYLASIKEVTDSGSKFAFVPETSINGSGTSGSNNRLSTSITGFNSTAKDIPGLQLVVGDAIGIWVSLTLVNSDYNINTVYGLGITGTD